MKQTCWSKVDGLLSSAGSVFGKQLQARLIASSVKLLCASLYEVNASELRSLYPPIEPYETGAIDVGDGHVVYFESRRGARMRYAGQPLSKRIS